MKGKYSKKIFWGVVFIAAAVLIVLDALAVVPDLPFVKIALGILCLSWAVKEAVAIRIYGIVFPAAFLFMIFEPEIALLLDVKPNIISNWIVLLVAVLLAIGLKLIFGGFKRRPKVVYDENYVNPRWHAKVKKNSFSGKAFYIDCADFTYEIMKNAFGASEIYFQNSELYDGGGVLEINNNFGAIEVYVPSDWNVVCDVNSVFGAVEQNGVSASGGKTLTVKGQNHFGAIEIYVK